MRVDSSNIHMIRQGKQKHGSVAVRVNEQSVKIKNGVAVKTYHEAEISTSNAVDTEKNEGEQAIADINKRVIFDVK